MPNEVQQEGLLQGLGRAIPLALGAVADTRSGRNQFLPLAYQMQPPTPEEQMMLDLRREKARSQIDSDKLRGILGLQRLEMQSQELDREQTWRNTLMGIGEENFSKDTPINTLIKAALAKGDLSPALRALGPQDTQTFEGLVDQRMEGAEAQLSLAEGKLEEDVKNKYRIKTYIDTRSVSDDIKDIMRQDQANFEENPPSSIKARQKNYVVKLAKTNKDKLKDATDFDFAILADWIVKSQTKLTIEEIFEILKEPEKHARPDISIEREYMKGPPMAPMFGKL